MDNMNFAGMSDEQLIQFFHEVYESEQDEFSVSTGKSIGRLITASEKSIALIAALPSSLSTAILSVLSVQSDVLINIATMVMRNNYLLESMKTKENLSVWEDEDESK